MRYDEIIKKHYSEESKKTKDAPESTMLDQHIRQAEVDAIWGALAKIAPEFKGGLDALEIGCGNGYLLSVLAWKLPRVRFSAIEFTEELLEIAKSRKLKNVELAQGDCRNLAFPDESFDAVFGERVLINLLDAGDQEKALQEISRVLKPGGYYLMVEGFKEPYENLNEARAELGMATISMPHHNLYFSESAVEKLADWGLEPCDLGTEPNFLSTHYFIARVLHEAVRTKDSKIHNTHFVKFFDQVLPRNTGNYAAIKFYSFRKARG